MKPFQKLLIIFFFSILTHLPGMTRPLLDFHGWAQTLRASIARNYARGGMKFFEPQIDFRGHEKRHASTQFPLYSYLVAVLYRLFGEADFLGRILSALFAAWSALVLYQLVRLFLREEIAACASLIYCCLPLRIYFMRTVMPESMAICFLLLGITHTVLWLRGEKIVSAIIAVLSLSLSCLLKLPYSFLIVFILVLFIQKYGKSFFARKQFWCYFLSILCIVGSWYSYSSKGVEALFSGDGAFKGEMNLFQEWGAFEFWSVHFLSRFPELLTTYAGLVFFAAGFYVLWIEKKFFFVVWFLSVIFYILLCGRYGRVHQYASLPFTPINSIFIAAGIVYYWGRWRSDSMKKYLVALIVLSIPVHAVLRIKHWYRLDDLWVLKAREAVAAASRPDDLFYIDAPDQPFYLYHLQRKGFTASHYPTGTEKFEEALALGAKFYFSPISKDWVEPVSIQKKFQLLRREPHFVLYRLKTNEND